jgi:hypothetical protein
VDIVWLRLRPAKRTYQKQEQDSEEEWSRGIHKKPSLCSGWLMGVPRYATQLAAYDPFQPLFTAL